MAKKNRYVVGIDGGGTKTAAVIADLRSTFAAEAKGPASNFQVIGVEKASEVLFAIVQECRRTVGCELEDIAFVLAGLTGAGRASDQKRMGEAFRSFSMKQGADFKNIRIESDARVALEGAFKGKPGIILIAGTGSIAFGKDLKGNICRVGGWGRTIGDEGGGYAIGRDGLNAVTRDLDGRGERTKLTKRVA
ncbi:MAG: putative N-acetylglucosamine kinase [Bacteroidetes bacterium]|nr:putative N-acetylglucosamine kinase [Bacteroidota bacterium]